MFAEVACKDYQKRESRMNISHTEFIVDDYIVGQKGL